MYAAHYSHTCHSCCSLIAFRYVLISLPPSSSAAAECLVFAIQSSLLACRSYFLASHTFILNARSTHKEFCCLTHIVFRRSVLVSRYSLLGCFHLSSYHSLLLPRCSLNKTYSCFSIKFPQRAWSFKIQILLPE